MIVLLVLLPHACTSTSFPPPSAPKLVHELLTILCFLVFLPTRHTPMQNSLPMTCENSCHLYCYRQHVVW